MATREQFELAGYYGRAYVINDRGLVKDLGNNQYQVLSTDGKTRYTVDLSDPEHPQCNCIRFRGNLATHLAALEGKRVLDVGVTCKHVLAVRAHRGEINLVETIKAMAEPLRARARAAAKGARMQYH